jgi:thiol-disulfide isomerase/thioredoxin
LAWISPDGRTLELAEAAYVPPKVPLIPGHKSPNFSFTHRGAGETFSLLDLEGEVVLLDFWATWCVPCLEELPHVKDVYQRYHDQGFEIVGISLDLDEGALRALLEDEGITWPQYFDGRGWENEVAKLYRVEAIPATFLLDRDGVIRYRDPRGEELERAVAELLAEPWAEEPEEAPPPAFVLPAGAAEPILELALPKEIGVLPGRETELSVGLINISAYPAEEVELSLVGLPAGIVAEPARLPSIPAFGQRTAVLILEATAEFSQELPAELRLRYQYCQGESCFHITQGAELMLVVGAAVAALRRPWNPWWLLGLLVVGVAGAWFLRGRRLSALFLVLLLVAGATVWAGVLLHQDRQAQRIGSVLCTSCVGIEEPRPEVPQVSVATREALAQLSQPVRLVVFHAPWCHSCPFAITMAQEFARLSPNIDVELVDAEEDLDRAEAALVYRSGRLIVPAVLAPATGQVVFGTHDLEARLLELVLGAGR